MPIRVLLDRVLLERRMSLTETVLPVRGWWSWRLTPWIRTGWSLMRSSRPPMASVRKPTRWAVTSRTVPCGSVRVTTARYSVGTSALHGSTPGASTRAFTTWPGKR